MKPGNGLPNTWIIEFGSFLGSIYFERLATLIYQRLDNIILVQEQKKVLLTDIKEQFLLS